LIAFAIIATSADAKVFFTQKQALALAFPDADRIEQATWVLTPEQVDAIQKQARSRLDSRLVSLHTAWRGGQVIGYAHIDVHTVRTKSEGFMIVLDPDGHVRSVRVLAFYEPLDYLPSERWYDAFIGKGRDDGLRIGRDVDAVSGATLSAQAATEGVRRMLAYYTVLLGA
jgi:Na+-translocating ferredoxin:NAD+ oxidoreductase RnfG subunit